MTVAPEGEYSPKILALIEVKRAFGRRAIVGANMAERYIQGSSDVPPEQSPEYLLADRQHREACEALAAICGFSHMD